MTAKQYKQARRARGFITDVAAKVGVHWTTINKRELGTIPITKEAELVLLGIPLLPQPVKDRGPGRPKLKK